MTLRPLLILVLFAACATTAPVAIVPLPKVETPLTICWIDTGGVVVPGHYGAGGAVKAESWKVTAPALLVRHPKGELLIDSGISPTAADEASSLGAWRRFVFSQTAGRNERRRSLPEALTALQASPKAIVLSHAHADHLGGASTLPTVPVWLAAEERDAVRANASFVIPAQAKAVTDRLEPLRFEQGPVLHASRSADLFGDGSVVVLPSFGHTPGSVSVLLNSGGLQWLYVGDLVNLSESVESGRGKSWIMKSLTDEDSARTQAEVEAISEVSKRVPNLVVLPAHDGARFEQLFGADTGPLPPCVSSAP